MSFLGSLGLENWLRFTLPLEHLGFPLELYDTPMSLFVFFTIGR